MQFKGTSNKDTCSDLLLPSSTDETGGVQAAHAAHDNVDVNHEKSPLIDVPLNMEELAMIQNRPICPSYKGDLSLNGVWSTNISQEYPGKPLMINRNRRELRLLSLIRLLIVSLGVYYCISATFTLVMNNRMAENIRSVQYEALKLVEPMEVIKDIPTEFEGKLIHVVGRIYVPVPLTYWECGGSTRSIKLKRVYDKSCKIRRDGFESYFPGDTWLNMPPGKQDLVCDSSFYEEEAIDYEQISDVATIGPLELSDEIKKKFDSYSFLTEKLQPISGWDAYRVRYTNSGANGEKYSVMGKLVNGKIQPHELPDFTWILKSDDMYLTKNMILDRVEEHISTLMIENRYSYFKIATFLPLTVILYFFGSMDSTLKNKRNHVMLSMPVH